MNKKFKWSKIDYGEGTGCYYAYYGKEELGYLDYYIKWKKWVWNQGEDFVMSLDCLEQVILKLKELKNERVVK